MRSILFTNIVFSERTGTEVATLELAIAMRARGHHVAIYSPTLGATATRARMLGIAVTSRIESIGYLPDIIHGSHNVVLALAMVRFPTVPALFTCHDSASLFDEPLLCARIGCYVAVDAACRDRLLLDGVDAARIAVLPNGVDLDRFTLRDEWPERPRSALLIVKQNTGHVALVAEACRQADIPLEVVGPGAGVVVSDLAERCRRADIVFAHSRSAIEAVAVGASVIVIDEFGFGGRFGPEQITDWPDTSLSRRMLGPMPTAGSLARLILDYDPAATRAVTAMLRERIGLTSLAPQWEALYDRAISQAGNPSGHAPLASAPDSDGAALSAFLARHLPRADQITEAGYAEDRVRTQQHNVQAFLDMMQNGTGRELTSIVFRPGSLGQLLLGSGWHAAEEWGVWSAAERASLCLPDWIIDRWSDGFDVVLSRYIPPDTIEPGARTITILLNAIAVATWYVPPGEPVGPVAIRITPSMSARPPPGHSVLLSFVIDRPVAPIEAGDGMDRRRLGVRLTAIEPAAGPLCPALPAPADPATEPEDVCAAEGA